jgi:hypothetical protein
MNFKGQLLSELSRKNIDYVIHVVGDNQVFFDEIVELMLNEKASLSMRAAWVVEGACLKYPSLIFPHLDKVIESLQGDNHPGMQRNITKILSRIEIPEKWHGFLVDLCFKWISDPECTVAVKVYSMQILENMVKIYPELKSELRDVIEDQFNKNSAGFKSRGGKILKSLGSDQAKI